MNSWQASPSQVDDSGGDTPSMAETRFEFRPISISDFKADIARFWAKLRLKSLEPLASAKPTILIGNWASLISLTICCASASCPRSIFISFRAKNLVINTADDWLVIKSRFSAFIGLFSFGNSRGIDLAVCGCELMIVHRINKARNPKDKSKIME